MSSETYRQPFVYSDADVVFSSSDGVRFKLHKHVLSLSSDFFKDMFSLPQPQSCQGAMDVAQSEHAASVDLPIVECGEPGNVLENLLRLCYRIRDNQASFSTIEEIRATIETAMKYEMHEAIHVMRRELALQIPTSPLRIYAIACRLELESEAWAALTEVSKQHVQDTYLEELEEIPAGAYYLLLAYCSPDILVRWFLCRASTNIVRPLCSTVPHSPALSVSPKLAPHPFSAEDAVISLVSSDGVDFRLSRLIIQLSSPILEAMLNDTEIPLGSDAPSGFARRTLYPPESSAVLTTILTTCYPVDQPEVCDFDDALAALTAAVRYGVQPAIRLLTPLLPALCDDPARLYIIACHLGLPTLAKAVAKDATCQDLSDWACPEMFSGLASGGDLYRLLDYQRRSKAAVAAIVSDRAWLQDQAERRTLSHHCTGEEGSYPCWFQGYMKALTKMDSPAGDTLTDVDFICRILRGAVRPGSNSSTPCPTCTNFIGSTNLMKFAQLVARRIEDAEAKIHLQWKS